MAASRIRIKNACAAGGACRPHADGGGTMEIGCYSAAVIGETLNEKLQALKEIGYDFLELTLRQEDVDTLDGDAMEGIGRASRSVDMPIRSLSGSVLRLCRRLQGGGDPRRQAGDRIGNALHAGEDPVAALSRLGGLVFQVHLKGIGDRPLERMPLDAVLRSEEHTSE